MNVIDSILRHAAKQPNARALANGTASLSYSQLHERASSIAAALHRHGVREGDTVAVRCGPFDFVASTIAISWVGGIWVPFANFSTPEMEELTKRLSVKFLLAAPALRPDPMTPGLPEWLDLSAMTATASPPIPVVQRDPEAPWRIGFSAGTTGRRKAIRFSHRCGAQRSELLSQVAEIGGERTMVLLGYALTFAVVYWMRELSRGTTVVFSPAAADPLQIIARENVDLVVGSPGNALQLLERVRKSGRPLGASVKAVMLGGAAVSRAHRELLREHLCGNLWINYGATEVGLVALLGPDLMDRQPAAAGRVMPWVEAVAVGESGAVLGADQEGVLRYRSSTLASGYELGAEASDADRHAFQDGWFVSGDRGSITAEGVLFLSSRDSDVINADGNKVDPSRVERRIEKYPGVQESALVGLPSPSGRLQLVAAVVSMEALDVAALREHCLAELQPWEVPQRFVRMAGLPRNEGGKVMRSQLLERLAQAQESR
jgi:acyl-coenzyme A synthetase/AMP-(fatty) acid ligase